jgi:hypothetical protein
MIWTPLHCHGNAPSADGKAIKRKLKRKELLVFFANYPVSLIGLEVGGAHPMALRTLEQEIQVQDKAIAAARKAVELTTNPYRAGTLSYLNVNTAQADALNNEITAVALLSQRLVAAVLLVKALGGDWS